MVKWGTVWGTEDITRFGKEARVEHKKYYDILGHKRWYRIEDWDTLREKVHFGLFGPFGNTITSKDQLDNIDIICKQLVKDFDFEERSIQFACIFIYMKVYDKRFTAPVFKARGLVENDSFQTIYVDSNGRRYKSWNDYLNYNTLRKCIYCYPAYGFYEKYEDDDDDDLIVKFGTSPACDLVCRVCRFTDITSTVINLTTFVIGIAVLCAIPIAGPAWDTTTAATGGSTNVYGIARSIYGLYDRVTHSQNIRVSEYEARSCWISILVSVLEITQNQMSLSMSNTAREGEVASLAGRIAFMVVQSGNFITNGIGIIHGLAVITRSERHDLKSLDVFQFSSSVMLFMNAAINFKTPSTIIKEAQDDIINNYKDGLTENALKAFNNQTEKLLERDDMYENAKILKWIAENKQTLRVAKEMREKV